MYADVERGATLCGPVFNLNLFLGDTSTLVELWIEKCFTFFLAYDNSAFLS